MIIVAWFIAGMLIGAAFMYAVMAKDQPKPVRDPKTGYLRNPENGQWVKGGKRAR